MTLPLRRSITKLSQADDYSSFNASLLAALALKADTLLTGFVSGAGVLSSADTILQAIQKLNGNDATNAPLASPAFTGTVGINTSGTPLTALHIAGADEAINGILIKKANNYTTNGDVFNIQDASGRVGVTFGLNGDGGYFRTQYVTGSPFMSSSCAGQNCILTISGGVALNAIEMDAGAATWGLGRIWNGGTLNSNFDISPGSVWGTAVFSITTAGKVGIGTVTPTAALDVVGSAKLSQLLNLDSYTNSSPADGDLWNDGGVLKFRVGGVTKIVTLT
jgi:hypothetical protein